MNPVQKLTVYMKNETANSIKVGFIYYSFYPVTGGASVHGFNLAKELQKLGYKLYKLNGEPDPHTKKMKNPVTGLFWILKNCDLIYLRMDYFLNLRNLISLFALISRKKIIVEINSPSDELYLFGRSRRYIKNVDRIVSKILKQADAVITVSEPLKKYCTEILHLDSVHVIENGGEVFNPSSQEISESVKQIVSEIKKNYSKIVVWSGSMNEMQDLSKLEQIAVSQKNKAAVLLIVKEEENKSGKLPQSAENLFIFKNLPRKDVTYIVSNSDIGLAFYSEYPWSRWGFYNSSLKIFEYLNNSLLTITNTEGLGVQRTYPNFKYAENLDEMIRIIDEYSADNYEPENPRTWSDVARETSDVIHKVVNQ